MSDLALSRAHPNICVQVYDGKPWLVGMRDDSGPEDGGGL